MGYRPGLLIRYGSHVFIRMAKNKSKPEKREDGISLPDGDGVDSCVHSSLFPEYPRTYRSGGTYLQAIRKNA